MTPIKRKLFYYLRPDSNLLMLRVSWNHGLRYVISLGYKIDKQTQKGKIKWSGDRCMPNTTHGENKIPASVINKTIENTEA